MFGASGGARPAKGTRAGTKAIIPRCYSARSSAQEKSMRICIHIHYILSSERVSPAARKEVLVLLTPLQPHMSCWEGHVSERSC
jgi:hypothetical protein